MKNTSISKHRRKVLGEIKSLANFCNDVEIYREVIDHGEYTETIVDGRFGLMARISALEFELSKIGRLVHIGDPFELTNSELVDYYKQLKIYQSKYRKKSLKDLYRPMINIIHEPYDFKKEARESNIALGVCILFLSALLTGIWFIIKL